MRDGNAENQATFPAKHEVSTETEATFPVMKDESTQATTFRETASTGTSAEPGAIFEGYRSMKDEDTLRQFTGVTMDVFMFLLSFFYQARQKKH